MFLRRRGLAHASVTTETAQQRGAPLSSTALRVRWKGSSKPWRRYSVLDAETEKRSVAAPGRNEVLLWRAKDGRRTARHQSYQAAMDLVSGLGAEAQRLL